MKGRPSSGGLPDLVEPMQAAPGEPPTGGDWAVEFAWEGLRCIAYARAGRVRLLTATGRNVTPSFPELEAPLAEGAGRGGMVLDGTVVALGESGFPRRRVLQSRTSTPRPTEALVRRVPVGFLVSDVLWLDGRSTVDLPYHRRRSLLEGLGLDTTPVWSSPSFPATELGFVMVAAEQHGAEALYAKHLDKPYRPGQRSRYWLRLPVRPVRQVVVGGWSPTDPERPRTIGALLLGVHDGAGGLRYVGRAGLRSAEDRTDLAGVLPAAQRSGSPFTTPLPAEVARHARWVEPRLVGRVEFSEWTSDGRLRLPTWRGLVPPEQVDEDGWADPPVPAPGTKTEAAPATAPAEPPAPAAGPPAPPPTSRHGGSNSTSSTTRSTRSRRSCAPIRPAPASCCWASPTSPAPPTHPRTPPARSAPSSAPSAPTCSSSRRGSASACAWRWTSTRPCTPHRCRPWSLLAAVRETVQQRIEPRVEGGTLAVTARAAGRRVRDRRRRRGCGRAAWSSRSRRAERSSTISPSGPITL